MTADLEREMLQKTPEKTKINLGKRIIVFIGEEGAGKSEVAKRLAAESGKPLISTSAMLHNLADNDWTAGGFGEKCRAMFADRVYLDGITMSKILLQRFSQTDVAEGFILDGGLRTVEETEIFQSVLEQCNLAMPVVVVRLHVPEEVTMDRLVTGPEARRRDDDTVDGVRKRLSKFFYRLDERIAFITSQVNWRLVQIDATENREQVYNQVCGVLALP